MILQYLVKTFLAAQ